MPNTREKLIELLKYSPFLDVVNGYKSRPTFEMAADNLIANGATVQEWIPVTDRLPEDGAVVLGYMVSRDYRTIKWKNNTQRWEGLLLDYSKEFVTHWMPLPQPPKGE